MSLTADEQRVVRLIGGWKIATLLANPESWSTDYFGASDFNALGNADDWLQCNSSKIEVGPLGSYYFTLKWTRVKAYARTLPATLRERIAVNNQAHQKHMAAYPRFAASAPACGHGRPVTWFGKEGPATEGQALYEADLAAWEASGVMGRWRAEGDALDTKRSGLLDEALPLAVPHEPTDLLELLEATA